MSIEQKASQYGGGIATHSKVSPAMDEEYAVYTPPSQSKP